MLDGYLQLPVINAHGVGLRSPKFPAVKAFFSDETGALKVADARIVPRLGQT